MDDPRLKLLDFPWFAENLLWIIDKAGKPVRLRLNNIQRTFHQADVLRAIVEKCRQCGFTTYMCARMFHRAITTPNYHGLIGSRTVEQAQRNLARIKIFMRYLPDWLRPEIKTDNVKEITFPALGSSLRIEAMGQGFGSGQTYSEVYMTECVYTKHLRPAYDAVEQAVPMGGRIVLDSHYAAEIVDSFFERLIAQARSGDSGYKPFRFTWRDHKEEYTEEWAEKKRRNMLPATWAAHYECDPTQAGEPVLDYEAIEKALADWVMPVINGDSRFVIGVDPAAILGPGSGKDPDFNAAVVLHLPSGAQVDQIRNRRPLFTFDEEVHELGQKWAKQGPTSIAVERNNSGPTVIRTLLNKEDKKYSVYYHRKLRKDDKGTEGFGWPTTEQTKREMYVGDTGIALALQNGDVTINNKIMRDELRRLQYTGKGIEAQAGYNDDLCDALAIAWAIRNYGFVHPI